MAVIITDMDMPKSCADCPMCHSKGKDEPWNYCCFVTMDDINIEEWDKERYITCPLKSADEMVAEISICKTENEMRIAERDYKNKLLISSIFSEVMAIIHKYTDKEQT